jgi:hypothetical protein
MIAQHFPRSLTVSEPKQQQHPVAELLRPLRTVWQMPARYVVPGLVVTVAALASAHWSPPNSTGGNGNIMINAPLPVPAASTGKAAWLRYYRSYDLVEQRVVIATIHAPAATPASGTMREAVPQPQTLPVDPTRTITAPAPTPTATPRAVPTGQAN